MTAPGEGRTCRGTRGAPGTCPGPQSCVVGAWIVCRKSQPERAHDAISSLARELAAEMLAPGLETRFATELTSQALKLPVVNLTEYPADRLLRTLLNDIASDLRWTEATAQPPGPWSCGSEATRPPPRGWSWKALVDALHREASSWVQVNARRDCMPEDLAGEAIRRLIETSASRREIRHPLAWARKVFVSLAWRAAHGKADGPFVPILEFHTAFVPGNERPTLAASPEVHIARR